LGELNRACEDVGKWGRACDFAEVKKIELGDVAAFAVEGDGAGLESGGGCGRLGLICDE
jgi:hypothetical protein